MKAMTGRCSIPQRLFKNLSLGSSERVHCRHSTIGTPVQCPHMNGHARVPKAHRCAPNGDDSYRLFYPGHESCLLEKPEDLAVHNSYAQSYATCLVHPPNQARLNVRRADRLIIPSLTVRHRVRIAWMRLFEHTSAMSLTTNSTSTAPRISAQL
jgi:hypothetical protein